jgi:hypothetical protein
MGACKFGYPRAIESNWDKQFFNDQLGEYNYIYVKQSNRSDVYQVSGVIANEETKFKFPTRDSETEDGMKVPGIGDKDKILYCKGGFTDGVRSNCKLLLQDMTSEISEGLFRKSVLTQKMKDGNLSANLISNVCATDYRFCKDEVGEMWIITHGMSGSADVRSDNHLAIGKAISTSLSSRKPLVLFYDWGEMSKDALGVKSFNVDQYLAEGTAHKVSKRLAAWGLNDLTNLNLVGHSMGTMLINQLAVSLQQKDKIGGEINRMFYLDAPAFLGGSKYITNKDNISNYATDYSVDNGFNNKGIKAKVQRAFVGQDDKGGDNACGNTPFANTANDSIAIVNMNASNKQGCRVHGGVPFVFAEVILNYSNGIKLDVYSSEGNSFVAGSNSNSGSNSKYLYSKKVNLLNDVNISNYLIGNNNIKLINNGYSNDSSFNLASGEITSSLESTAITKIK